MDYKLKKKVVDRGVIIMKDSLSQKTISGMSYRLAERISAQGISFIISIILARLMSPNEFGIIALVISIIAILDVFVTYGFGNALIVNKESDIVDFSTCFYFGIVLSILVYTGIFFISPYIALFYGIPVLKEVIRVMSIRIIISAVNSVQHAYISKNLLFKHFFYSTLIGTLISGVIATIMVYNGFGIWALVAQYIGKAAFDTIFLWFTVRWRPKMVFSWQRLKKIYAYGWKILVVGLIDTGYSQLRSLLIAKKYSSQDLAYYNKGMQFPALGMSIIEPAINGVMLPVLAQVNDDLNEMKQVVRKTIQLTSYIIFPLMIGLAVVAKPLIIVLLTEKWLGSVIFLQIGCFAFMQRPVQVINNVVIKATGRSGLLLKLNIIKKSIGIFLLIGSLQFGIIGIAISLLLANFFSTMINIFPNRKIINYGYIEQFNDIMHSLAISILMGIVTYMITFLDLPVVIMLIIQIAAGIISYVLISKITGIASYSYIKNYFSAMLSKLFSHKFIVNNKSKRQ